MSSVRVEYRVDGRDLYIIALVPQRNGTYQLFARLHPPDLHGRGAAHHHLYDSKEICVNEGRKPRSVVDAKKIAKVWAECWSTYCRTGRFPGS